MSKQVRFIGSDTCGLQVRETEGQQGSRVIAGRPIVFGVRSHNLTPWSSTRVVYEILEHGCISREVLQKSDIILNLNHNSNVVNVLGRYRNNPDKDTLKLEMRGDGIDCECDLPETTAANDTLTLIKRGDITGMSFAFDDDYEDSENGVSYEKTNDIEDGKVVWLRHVKKITALYDVSIVTHPAYDQTSVATREESDRINEAIEAQLKREQGQETEEEKQAREKAEREAADKAKAEEEAKAKEEQEAKEKAEREAQEKKEREAVAVMRMRQRRLALQQDIDNSIY